MSETPRIFRVVLEVSDLARAVTLYSELLGVEGRMLRGSRAYFDCGGVILALLDPAPGDRSPTPNAEDLYFSVTDLEEVYERARRLGWLSDEDVHDAKAGEIVIRPWGERSFYAQDPWGNGLCFVDARTLYTGK